MPVLSMPIAFIVSRVLGIMDVKDLDRNEYLSLGFKRGWIANRQKNPDEPKGQDLVRLAGWLEVPVEYLYGAAPEYDAMPTWEVASRASLEFFLKRNPDGRVL